MVYHSQQSVSICRPSLYDFVKYDDWKSFLCKCLRNSNEEQSDNVKNHRCSLQSRWFHWWWEGKKSKATLSRPIFVQFEPIIWSPGKITCWFLQTYEQIIAIYRIFDIFRWETSVNATLTYLLSDQACKFSENNQKSREKAYLSIQEAGGFFGGFS